MMTQWVISPYQGVNNLHFGMTRSEAQSALGSTPFKFMKSSDSDSDSPTDAYNEFGMHIYYDGSDTIEFIEMFPPAEPVFGSINIFDTSVHSFVEAMEKQGYVSMNILGSIIFYAIGIALYAPSGAIEGVSVFRRGYYDHSESPA